MLARSLFATALAVTTAGPAAACYVDNSTWESRVLSAKQIVVLECVTAGYHAGRYRVVEAWLPGTQVGSELTLGRGGAHLVGDRLLLLGDRARAGTYPNRPVNYMSSISTTGNRAPLGGRRLGVDRRVRFDIVPLPLSDGERPLRRVRSPHRTLREFKAAAQELLAVSSAEGERRVLQSLAEAHLRGLTTGPWAEVGGPLLERVRAANRADQIARLLLTAAIDQPGLEITLLTILRVGGREQTLEVLEERTLPTLRRQERTRTVVAQRLGLKAPTPLPPPATAEERKRISERALGQLQASLTANEEGLYAYLGEPVDLPKLSTQLRDWTDDRPGSDSYWFASTYCVNLPDERPTRLRALLGAKSPWVRVAGAVYLALEGQPDASTALRTLAELEGDPGSWAALTLARQGDRTVVPRLLEVFAAPPSTHGKRAALPARARVLLSNAAAQAGLPQPPSALAKPGPEAHAAALAWWHTHAARLELRDPWAAELEAQRID